MYRNLSQAFRNPLATLTGYTDFLFQYSKDLTQEHKQELVEVRDAAIHMGHLIDTFLDVASFDLEAARLNKSRVNLVPLTREVCRSLREWLRFNQLRLDTSLPKRPVMISGDPDWIRSMVRGLIAQAVRVSPQGSKIELTLSAQKGDVILAVRDQGRKPSGSLNRIFRPFLESRRPTDGSRPDTGGGLELALAECVAKAHGGRTWATNGSGGGVRVHVSFPLAVAAGAKSRPRKGRSP